MRIISLRGIAMGSILDVRSTGLGAAVHEVKRGARHVEKGMSKVHKSISHKTKAPYRHYKESKEIKKKEIKRSQRASEKTLAHERKRELANIKKETARIKASKPKYNKWGDRIS
jgi:chemotaxis response regulator CheB